MKTTRLAPLLAVLALGTASSLLATLDHQKMFVAKYPDAKAKLGKCSTCHTAALPKKDAHDLNAYGTDLQKAMSADKKSFDFAKVEALDSDGDGVSNLDEIKAGTNPGAK